MNQATAASGFAPRSHALKGAFIKLTPVVLEQEVRLLTFVVFA